MSARLDGKVVLITGGARGQGASHARACVAEGAKVAIADLLDEPGEALAAELGAMYLHLDVSDEVAWEAAVESVVERFGGLHGLVNNAGILSFNPISRITADEFMNVVKVNQLGTLLGTKFGGKAMRATGGGGSIVNISSTQGMWGSGLLATYSASKFAIRGISRSAAIEYGRHGIRVNVICPGGVDTEMGGGGGGAWYDRLPLGRIGQPDDISGAVVFLLSDESRYMTGTEMVIDGGSLAGDLGLFDT